MRDARLPVMPQRRGTAPQLGMRRHLVRANATAGWNLKSPPIGNALKERSKSASSPSGRISTHRRPDARLAPEEDGLIKFMVDDRNVEVHASGSGRSVKTAGIALWGDTTYSDDSGTTEVSLRPVSSRRRRWPPGCGYREGVVPFHDCWSRARGYERVRSISFVAHQDGGAVQGRPSLRLAPTVSEREARPRFARSAQLENIVELSRRPIRPVTRRTT